MLNTPFLGDDTLDSNGLRAHVRYARRAGVAGFLVNGLAAEVGHLSREERLRIARQVVAESGGVPVTAGLGNAADANLEAIATQYLDAGCAGLLLNGADASERDLLRVLTQLNQLGPGFLMLQDWDASGSGIPVPTLLRLVEAVPALTWLKIEVRDAGPKYSELLRHGPPTLRVAGGWAVREMMDGLERGVHAFMPTALHGAYARIYRMFSEGRRDDARAVFERVRPILDFSNQSLDISIAFFKRLLHAQRIYATDRCRAPGARFDAGQQRDADRLIALAMDLESTYVSSDSAAE